MKDEVNQENVQSWVEFLRGFDQARGHFAEAYRQTLLGTAETLRAFQQAAGSTDQTPGSVVSLLDLIRKGLVLWADRIPGILDASSLDLAKREALVTVKEVLLAELIRTREEPETGEESRVKIEALEAILRVVEMELTQREQPEATVSHETLRRVVIE